MDFVLHESDDAADLFQDEPIDDPDRDPDWSPSNNNRSNLIFLPEGCPSFMESSVSSGENCVSTGDEISATENEPSLPREDGDGHNNEGNGTRKRLQKQETWKKNLRKINRNRGQEYVSTSGKVVPARTLKPPCTEKCRLHCLTKVSEEKRLALHKAFWEVGDINTQRAFLVNNMKSIIPNRVHSRRGNNFCYYLLVDGTDIRVCKSFFLSTYGISERYVYTAWKKRNDHGFVEEEKRGKHNNHTKVSEDILTDIRSHIKAFPTVESHYVRAGTKRQYLDGSLSIAEMYRMYKKDCEEKGNPYGKQYLYEKLFSAEFNIGFHAPKKDLCMLCQQFQNANEEEKIALACKYDTHILNKERSRSEKEKDVKEARENENLVVCDFDLQAILPTPSGDVSLFFYKRRLNVYNFTIFDNGSKQGYCYLWSEVTGNKGANEIASCVFRFITTKCATSCKQLIMYSDNCTGQNKNKYIATMYLHALQNTPIESITHKFLITGHTQNAGDSMHSCIERQKKRALKSGPIYVPNQWAVIAKCAKKTGSPYEVTEINWSEFQDFKLLSQEFGNNYRVNEEGEVVKWASIKVLKVEKGHENSLFYKTDYGAEFKKINLRRQQRARRQTVDLTLRQAYSEAPCITAAKKKDLLSLCTANVIPRVYHNFFQSLPTSRNTTEADDDSENEG